uniref:AAA+ ATPase domain-containing protein n=1 Tax=Oryza barthii TaxID=65489 RepID=A0A0D3F3R2_9ORYZ
MELATGALPSVIAKLGDLLVGEYNLQKAVKGEIRFLQSELESMHGALGKVSATPADQLDPQDKIWARDLRELSFDIEDTIDAFVVRGMGDDDDHSHSAKPHGISKLIDRSVGLFRKAKARHGIASEIMNIKSRVVEVHERRRRYEINIAVGGGDKPATIDPRLFARYTDAKELVGIGETRDELIKILTEENGVSVQRAGKVVSIVGFGGLGKTTLANAVYEKIRPLFDCCAFVSVSQTPDLKKLFKGTLCQLDAKKYERRLNENPLDEVQLINELREFLQQKRYFIVMDDIWDISIWKIIKCALPGNDVGYKIITTTRIFEVAEKAGGVYKLKNLSLNNSRRLLYGRIFGNCEDTGKCPDEELAEVSERILKKCAGVPLAIITMASLLACKARNKMEWYEVYNSVGTGLENSLDVKNMRKILSFSYYDLPPHLRTCLLYLSVFPEDYKIEKDHLIWMWIAEGFIQCEKQGRSLFELGESYFNDLVNRSMIQPIYDMYTDIVSECRVHDMILDLICSLSSEENFVTILNGRDQGSLSYTIRRLSLQNGNEDHAMTSATRSLQQARTALVFPSATDLVPVLRSFRVLRVLDLQGCDLSQGYSLKYVGNLFHLRYLGLRDTHIREAPEEIGNIQFLQTLNLRENPICDLPLNIVKLRHLTSLCFDGFARVPDGIGSLTMLEHLANVLIDCATVGMMEELGNLTELRVLCIIFWDGWNDKLLGLLQKLQKIQRLSIDVCMSNVRKNIGGLDAWVAPRHLVALKTENICWFSSLPAWMTNPSHVPNLRSLSIAVREIRQADVETLGRLPALRDLQLQVDHEELGIRGVVLVIGSAGSFACLVCCGLWGFVGPAVFRRGAMPRLRTLRSRLSVREAIAFAGAGDDGLDLGLGSLPSLQEVNVSLDCEGASEEEVKELKAALRRATKIHPNHPSISIDGDGQVSDDERE